MPALARVLPASVRPWVGPLRRAERMLTAPRRAMPDFIILGAQKAGTTSLFDYLSAGSSIRTSSVKEVHYYDLNHRRGRTWYRSHFPYRSEVGPGTVVGEASPYYLVHPHAPKRIHDAQPEVRLVVLLRDPTRRAISHYEHEVRNGNETLPLMEALLREDERIGAEWARMVADPRYDSPAHRSFSYKQRGVYADQLERYLALFPRDQLLVMDSARLFSNPEQALREVCTFLGVAAEFDDLDLTPSNVGGYDTHVDPAVERHLDEYFAPHNARLETLLDRELGW